MVVELVGKGVVVCVVVWVIRLGGCWVGVL